MADTKLAAIDWARADKAYEAGKKAYVDWCRAVAQINAAGDRQQEIADRYNMGQPAVAKACVIGQSEIIRNANNLPADKTALYELAATHKEKPEQVDAWIESHPEPTREDVRALRESLAPPKSAKTVAEAPPAQVSMKRLTALLSAWDRADKRTREAFLIRVGIMQPDAPDTWKHYADAYNQRYGVDPVRNARVNAQFSQLTKRLGSDAPFVAAHYVSSNNSFYVQKGHAVGPLLADAEKLRTEWATNRRITSTKARQGDQRETQGAVWAELIAKAQAEGGK